LFEDFANIGLTDFFGCLEFAPMVTDTIGAGRLRDTLGMTLKAALYGLSLAAFATIAFPALGQKQTLGMLDALESGGWELRERGGDASVHSICLDNGRRLIQLRHPGAPCNSVVVADSAMQVTVQYTCHGQGYGRTQIRRETNRLIQIDTQGIANGLPFSYSAEGRRTGECRSS
jgi:hypothetical protein